MTEIRASIQQESQDRYLSYALSVVSGRALPDVRDGLKPVQRRILFAMFKNLGLRPSHSYKKSAAVVGEVLARFHPHGDTACYEAMVRMAQDFSLRYPLVDGQGNFGSLDGDSAAAYRYTEARLRELAIDVIGEIDEDTVEWRDNFDSSTKEPVVFPSRVPNLLINGASGIAVGMATSIPPHNLRDVVKGLIELIDNPEVSIGRLTTVIKAPDFPTGGQILNTRKELEEIYRTGRGSLKLRGEWHEEELPRGKKAIVISSIPYAINKAQLVEKFADLIIARKVPQLIDVRDESTEEIRIVLELAPGAQPEVAMAYLFKNTPLENYFSVNLTVIAPTGKDGTLRPETLSLKACLEHFINFRDDVVRRRLEFERRQLLDRIHILEGLVLIFDRLDDAIQIVRKSDGRSDAAERLRKAFKLTEIQSFAIVDMRVYQLSKTNILEIREELKEKTSRVKAIEKTLQSPKAIRNIVRDELEKIAQTYGDKRRSTLVQESDDIEFKAEDYIVHEDVFAIVTSDSWIKRIRQTNEVSGTRVREGDSVAAAHALSTADSVVFFTNLGNIFSLRVNDFPASSGFGDPLQKLLKFKDGEKVIASYGVKPDGGDKKQGLGLLVEGQEVASISKTGLGYILKIEGLLGIKRSGKRFAKLKGDDEIAAVGVGTGDIAIFTEKGHGLVVARKEVPVRESAGLGVQLMKVGAGDEAVAIVPRDGVDKLAIAFKSGRRSELTWSSLPKAGRGGKGQKVASVAGVTHVVRLGVEAT